jgi:hypothetical protein
MARERFFMAQPLLINKGGQVEKEANKFNPMEV